MDIQYILLNTIIYGIIALCLSSFFSFGKLLNLSIGGFLVMAAYVLYNIIMHGFGLTNICMLAATIGIYLLVNRGLLKYFPNDKQRDHAGIVITLGLSIFLWNLTNYVYGSDFVSLDVMHFGWPILLVIFVVVISACYYFFKHTLWGVVYRAIDENGKIIRGLGINVNKILQILFAVLFVLIVLLGFIILNESSLKASDGLFYIVKGIGIMILVGLGKKEYMLLGSLLYVLVEYLLFIQIGLPIGYKETLILVAIVLLLLFKPEGLFAFKKRKI